MSIHSRRIATLLITLILAAFSTSSAHAEAIVNITRVTETFHNEILACNGEGVLLSGEISIVYHVTLDPADGLHASSIAVSQNIQGVGSETGVRYRAVQAVHEHFNVFGDTFPLTSTHTEVFNLISQGSTDNLRVRFLWHIIVNPDGTVVVDSFTFSSECVG